VTLKTPLFMQAAGGDTAPSYSALDVRALLGMLLRNEGILHALSPGLTALKVSQRAAGANFSVDVAAGAAVITGDDVSNQGMYAVQSTAVENLVIPAPPVSGTRVHRVVARIKDHLHDGSWAVNTYVWALEVLEDVGSGTPATPASAISLATVSVAAAQSSVLDANIGDTRVAALLGPGRPTVVTSSTVPANPATAETIWRSDLQVIQLWNGSAWVSIGPPSAPVQVVDGTNLTAVTNTTFAAGSPVCGTAFTAPPSGKVIITLTGEIEHQNNASHGELTYEVRTGATVGSGSVFLAADYRRGIMAGNAVTSGGEPVMAGSNRYLLSGLTPGSSYNARTMHRVSGGTGQIFNRALLVEFV
jgi:hypothetical protein